MRLLLALLALLPSAALAEAAAPAQTDPTIWYALASVAMLLSFVLMHWLVVVRR